jgi:glycosyltransferase involved in cell wall biosynthesis
MKKNISVIMANYNHSKYLNDRIESFAKQILKPLEIIIVDDKSTDDSVRILEKLKKKYKFLKILKNTKNLGVNKSINKAVRIASGKYIYPCSVDDILYRNDFFYETVNFLEKYKGVDICMTYPSFYDDRYKTFKNQLWILPFKNKTYYTNKYVTVLSFFFIAFVIP